MSKIKVSVFSHSIMVIEDKVNQLHKESRETVVAKRRTTSGVTVETIETIFEGRLASSSQRGSRSHFLYIDKYTDPNTVYDTILPTLTKCLKLGECVERCTCPTSERVFYF